MRVALPGERRQALQTKMEWSSLENIDDDLVDDDSLSEIARDWCPRLSDGGAPFSDDGAVADIASALIMTSDASLRCLDPSHSFTCSVCTPPPEPGEEPAYCLLHEHGAPLLPTH